jgi:hypothetical protein
MEGLATNDVRALVNQVQKTIDLNNKAGGVPNVGVFEVIQIVFKTQFAEISHDVPSECLTIGHEQNPFVTLLVNEPLHECRFARTVPTSENQGFKRGAMYETVHEAFENRLVRMGCRIVWLFNSQEGGVYKSAGVIGPIVKHVSCVVKEGAELGVFIDVPRLR